MIERYKKSAELDPNDVDAWINLADAYYDESEYEAAIEAYQKAIGETTRRTQLEPIRREKGYSTEEEDCQKIIDESQLPEYLKKQWHVVCTLPSGKIVVSNE